MSGAEQIGFSIVGMGRAGQARQARLEAHPLTHVVSTVSRREPDGATFETSCADPTVDAMVICTENELHPVQGEHALRAGKHVLVEYPLAFDGKQCQGLFDLAQRQKRILQVEFIGQLTRFHEQMAALVASEPVAEIRLDFRGSWYRWVEVEARAEHWGQLAVSRLLSVQQWCGPVELKTVALIDDEDGYQLDVRLEAANGVQIAMTEQRRRVLKRGQTIEMTLTDGQQIVPERPREGGDLFARDLDIFVRQILDPNTAKPYVSQEDIIQMTELASEISQRAAASQ